MSVVELSFWWGLVLGILAGVSILCGKISESGEWSPDLESFLKRVRDTYSDLRRKQ